MGITTKAGDGGHTALMYGRKVSKVDPRLEACGTVDELNAALGMAHASAQQPFLREKMEFIQSQLFVLMGELACAREDLPRYLKEGFKQVSPEMIAGLEAVAAVAEKDAKPHRGWAVPGAAMAPATLDLARAVCRRAERCVCRLQDSAQLDNKEIIVYLNRLSDLLWLLARWAEEHSGSTGESGS